MTAKLNFFPALKAHIGPVDKGLDYYILKMRMADVIKEIKFAHEFELGEGEVNLLGEAIQRGLNDKRVRDSICRFLQKDHRFFSSLVAATLDGNPSFFPVSIAEGNEANMVFKGSGIDESFGVLRMDETRMCYALDGQHRLAAIRSLLDPEFRKEMKIKEDFKVPDGFAEEEISVIMVLRDEKDPDDFEQGFRRLFASLNRHAKKTDQDTNIIMDEDDAFAILTRRLINEFPFFRDESNPQSASSLVKMKGSNLNPTDTHFTTLKTLYDMNAFLLRTAEREKIPHWRSKTFIADRPEDEELNQWYTELASCWEAILKVLPDLRKIPQNMRQPGKDKSKQDHLFFRPIGQLMMARLVRELLDKKFPTGFGSVDSMAKELAPLGNIDWDIRNIPWQRLVSVPGQGEEGFVMRGEQRTAVMDVAQRMAKAMITAEEMDKKQREKAEAQLRSDWEKYLSPRPEKEELDKLWNNVVKPKLKL